MKKPIFHLQKKPMNIFLPKSDGIIISKKRYEIPHGAFTIELDIFEKDLEGLVVAEVEFDSVEEANEYVPPHWFGEEVTMDKKIF